MFLFIGFTIATIQSFPLGFNPHAVKSPDAFIIPDLTLFFFKISLALSAAYPFPIAPNPIFIPFNFKNTVESSLFKTIFLYPIFDTDFFICSIDGNSVIFLSKYHTLSMDA